VSTVSAIQTIPKPTHSVPGTASCATKTPQDSWRIGARNCSRPTVDSGRLLVLAAKQINGITVTSPAPASSAVTCQAAWPNTAWWVVCR
jgi:hypothetical protein